MPGPEQPTNLFEWQRQLQHAIVHGGDAAGLALRAGAITRERQLLIYRNAYVLRMAEALRCNFPALHQLLGDVDFDAMSQLFLQTHPSTTASIRWFGAAIAEFLQHTNPFAGCPAMADLARFEWALRHTIDAADAERVTLESMQSLAPQCWGSLAFDLHPSVGVLRLAWNAPAIWQALTQQREPPQPEAQPHYWLVYRDNALVTQWRSVADEEATALLAWRDGADFDAICELAAQTLGETAAAIGAASWLKSWIAQGLLVRRSH